MTPAGSRASGASVAAALLVVYVVWGSTYLAIRVVVEAGLPPLLSMGTRFLLAGGMLAAVLAVRGGRARLRVSGREMRGAAVMGLLLLTAGNGGVAIAEQTVPSGLAALIVGAVPLWLVLLRISGGERPVGLTWAGVILGFAGIAAISLPRGGIEGVQAWGVALILAGSACWATGSYLAPRLGLPRDPLVATTYEMLAGGAFMVLGGLLRGEAARWEVPGESAGAGWAAWLYLVVVGSLVGYTAYTYLLAHAPISLVGTYAYVNPVVAVLLGWAILAEPVTAVVLGGGALVVFGVGLVVTGERRSRRVPQSTAQSTAQSTTQSTAQPAAQPPAPARAAAVTDMD